MLSGTFRNMGAAAQSSFNQINAQMARHNQNATLAGRSINDLTARMNRLKESRADLINVNQLRTANREIALIEQRISRMQGYGTSRGGGGGMLGSIVGGNLLAGGIGTAIGLAKNTIMESLEASMAYGMQERSFQVLTKDARRGKDLAAELRQMKQTTLVGAGVYGNAQTMLGFGVGAGNVMRNLREVGDVGMGDTQRMQSLTLARSQVHAAGRLMGNDLLQFINAGFNPLSVMSDKWAEFGFKTKVSIGQLKELVEKGAISSDMVDKAFTIATSKGGQFYKMMDQIGDTAGGKMRKMKGNWAALQIDMGNALTPIASSFMDAASEAMHFLNISKSVPDTLRTEQMEINSLVGSITKMNEGNRLRGDMIERLKDKYPDLYGNIDTEKVKNSELLDMLKKVNKEYENRIKLSTNQATALAIGKQLQDTKNRADKFAVESQSQSIYGKSSMSVLDADYWKGGYGLSSGVVGTLWSKVFNEKSANNLRAGLALAYSNKSNSQIASLEDRKREYDKRVELDTRHATMDRMLAVFGSPDKQKELWGDKSASNLAWLNKEWQGLRSTIGNTPAFLKYDFSTINSLLNNDISSNSKGKNKGLKDVIDETTNAIIGGGSKSITIHVGKFQDKTEIHSATVSEGVAEMEDKLAQMFLRILQTANAAR